jgi:hypothetical protein
MSGRTMTSICVSGLDAVEKGGMSRRGAAERFGVSESSATKWVERTGLRTAARMGGYKPRKLVLTGNFGGPHGPRGRTSRRRNKEVCLHENWYAVGWYYCIGYVCRNRLRLPKLAGMIACSAGRSIMPKHSCQALRVVYDRGGMPCSSGLAC